MTQGKFVLAAVLVLGVAGTAGGEALASGSDAVLRNQTRIISGAVQRQVGQAFYAARRANVRAAPSRDAQVIGQLEPGAPVAVTRTAPQSGWYEVQVDGRTGYVAASLVESR